MSAHSSVEAMPSVDSDERTLLPLIRHMGRTLEDIEHLRIMHTNRRGAFERDFNFRLPPDEVLTSLITAEHAAKLELIRLWRRHRLAPWAKQVRGVGEKSIARLIAEIGDPAERPNVAKLWSYCGLNPDRRRRRGMSQEAALACGNPQARKQIFLISEALLKAGVRKTADGDRYPITPHGELYLARKHATNDRGWTDGHRHADALRIVGKQLVKELWIASRQASHETHAMTAGGAL